MIPQSPLTNTAVFMKSSSDSECNLPDFTHEVLLHIIEKTLISYMLHFTFKKVKKYSKQIGMKVILGFIYSKCKKMQCGQV